VAGEANKLLISTAKDSINLFTMTHMITTDRNKKLNTTRKLN